jgi:hypothetical protein
MLLLFSDNYLAILINYPTDGLKLSTIYVLKKNGWGERYLVTGRRLRKNKKKSKRLELSRF